MKGRSQLLRSSKSFMCKSLNKLPWSVTLGCPVQRNPGVKPARSSSLRVTEFTPKLAPFSLKTHVVPDRLWSSCGDLLPQYTPHINISSTCHHPGPWGPSQRCGPVIFFKSYFYVPTGCKHKEILARARLVSLEFPSLDVLLEQTTNRGLSWSTFTVGC